MAQDFFLPQQESSLNSTRAALSNLMKYDQLFADPVEGLLLPLKDDRVGDFLFAVGSHHKKK